MPGLPGLLGLPGLPGLPGLALVGPLAGRRPGWLAWLAGLAGRLSACAALCRPVAALRGGLEPLLRRIADIDAWRPKASMPGWLGWLACLACLAWPGWLGRIDWNDCLKSHTLDALEEVGGFQDG